MNGRLRERHAAQLLWSVIKYVFEDIAKMQLFGRLA